MTCSGIPLYIMATIGTKDFGHYRGVATNQGFYKYYFNAVRIKVSGYYREGGHSSEMAIKRGLYMYIYRFHDTKIPALYIIIVTLSFVPLLPGSLAAGCDFGAVAALEAEAD